MPASGPDPASTSSAPAPGFGLYIHWPFCLSKCPYCDFNSHVREQVDQARWRRALLAELAHFAAQTPGRTLTSIFFGGGTPSLMPPETVGALINAARGHWSTAPDLEITLEANPTSVEADRLAAFRDAGVNRVSLGVQALDDGVLKFLGRGHSAAEAIKAVELAAHLFDRFSFDLIYARPGQSVAEWQAELRRGLKLAGDHLSLYTLTIEANTGFAGAVARGAFIPPDGDANAALYEATQDVCDAAGLPAYEISNHARPGFECRHNLTYWRYGDYVGVGPGAHGRFGTGGEKRATQQWKKPERWLEQVEQAGHGTEAIDSVDLQSRAAEALMMGLRLTEGVYAENFNAVVGAPLQTMISAPALRRLIDGGMAGQDASRLWVTAKGRPVLDSVLGALLA